MLNITSSKLSEQGIKFLSDPLVHEVLSGVAASVGVTPEEYLLRFEEVMSENPEAILGIFENLRSKGMKNIYFL